MRTRTLLITLALLFCCALPALAGPLTFAWSETTGWLDYAPTGGGATVYADHLEGYTWAENIGWVALGSYVGRVTVHQRDVTMLASPQNRCVSR